MNARRARELSKIFPALFVIIFPALFVLLIILEILNLCGTFRKYFKLTTTIYAIFFLSSGITIIISKYLHRIVASALEKLFSWHGFDHSCSKGTC